MMSNLSWIYLSFKISIFTSFSSFLVFYILSFQDSPSRESHDKCATSTEVTHLSSFTTSIIFNKFGSRLLILPFILLLFASLILLVR